MKCVNSNFGNFHFTLHLYRTKPRLPPPAATIRKRTCKKVFSKAIDGNIAHPPFRKGNPRCTDAGKYKNLVEQSGEKKTEKLFETTDFTFQRISAIASALPANACLYRTGGNTTENILRRSSSMDQNQLVFPVNFVAAVCVSRRKPRSAKWHILPAYQPRSR